MSSSKTTNSNTSHLAAQRPNLIQFLESVPPPITHLLVELAPIISWLRWAAEVFSWKSHWTDPWLTLAAWWTLCLGTDAALRRAEQIYLLPLAFLLPALLPYLSLQFNSTSQKLPATEYSIATSLSDITILRTLIPTLPALPPLQFATALRISAVLYFPYVLTTHFVPMPILLGIAGTLLITYRAPWACTLRTILGRSAYVQRLLLRVWCILSGSEASLYGTQVGASSASSKPESLPNTSALASASPPIQFIFTILECQRWWMGLDWTAALLPGERPSWCSLSHQPAPPPCAFSLPPPTTVFLPVPNGKRVKRTATWRWEDSEWRLLINKDGAGVKRIERKPPGLEDESGSSIATRAASMLKERTASVGSASDPTPGKDDRDPGTNACSGVGAEQELGEELHTDVDGWIYGDNKWETASAKGGLGKYTRYRRWTRIAVLEEIVEDVGPGELGIFKETIDLPKPANEEKNKEENPRTDTRKRAVTNMVDHPDSEKDRDALDSRGDGEEKSPLKERLKSAVKSVRNAS